MLPSAALALIGWALLLLAAPSLPGHVSAVLYGLGSFICHQIPERSFHVNGFQLPVCARCFGLYAGAAAGASAFAWIGAVRLRALAAIATARTARRAGALLAAPTAVTIAFEVTGLWAASNLTRAFAGLCLGAGIALVVMNALATLHYDQCALPRPTGHKPPP